MNYFIESTVNLLDHNPQFSETSLLDYELSSGFSEYEDSGELLGPIGTIEYEFDQFQLNSLIAFLRFKNRIKLLSEQARSEDYSINPESERTFWEFFKNFSNLKYGSLFLLDNGNLEATWDDDRENHVGLEFISRQTIGFVIFRNRSSSEPVSRLSGLDTMNGIEDLISVYGLKEILTT